MNSVSPKRHIDGAVAPLMFININNKHELFAVPKEYPYKQSGETISDDQQKAAFYADMVYPILPKIVKTPRRTLVPFSSASNEEQDITFNTRLDIEVLPKIEQIVNGEAKDLDPLIQDTTKCLSQEFAKDRRHYLFSKQWKRNALNDWLQQHYIEKFDINNDITLKENLKRKSGANTTAMRFIDNMRPMKRDKASVLNDVAVKDWINAGPTYSKTLSEMLRKYHEFLHQKQQSNGEIKRKVASTSRYFFEILAEAKECERKMQERELVTEERLYGRKDFIADLERENQLNKNRCKKLYSLYLNCQRKNQCRGRETALYVGESPNREQQVTAAAAVTAANVNNVENSYDMNQCNTTADPEPNTQENNEHTSSKDEDANVENPSYSVEIRNQEAKCSTVITTAPTKSENTSDAYQQSSSHINRSSSSNSAWDEINNLQSKASREVPASRTLTYDLKDEPVTPKRQTEARNATSRQLNSSQRTTPRTKDGSRMYDSNYPFYGGNTTSMMDADLQLSNRLSTGGGVNKWIYSKMEERGELEGYRLLLNELNALLFSNGNVVMGYTSLPQALEWLDETDVNRMIVPPSQENFRDGTLYTACSFVEIKLMKMLQGGIYALRSRQRSVEFDTAVLQQILEVNNELLELKRRVDNGRCALYKKLKRDWAERNSKWAGFPPLKRGYRLLNMLGKGGFAEVWEVLDPITLTVQAAKLHILSHDMNSVERGNVVMRVKNEIDIHKTCRTHKNIVNMKACFEMGDNMLATILELCDDGDLDHYIKLHAPVPEKLALTWTYQILEGLHYMKTLPEGRVHHCDLKPGNILKHKGNIKLADFGLSKMVPHQSTMELWGGGGTILYQPPECLLTHFRSNQVILTDKIDIWAVGCILYEMLYNSRPFGFIGGRRSLSERMYQAIVGGVKFPPNDRVSDGCKELIMKFLSFDPNARPSIEEAMSSPLFHLQFQEPM